MSDLREKLRAVVPPAVMAVCRTLGDAGFEAHAVGGAVRDAIIGRPIGDWDIATSAHPDEVQSLFRKTIPTGIEHGTVTVVLGRGDERMAIEVTTFRGEGAYSDSRRPDDVVFGVPLDEDLARRDLVINAIAYDPLADVLHDPFGGQKDIEERRIRAVGVAAERFTEDGLRVMRAVRFAAQLEFSLDADTEAAISVALPSLAKVAVERVREELHKLLKARAPSLGLVISRRAGVFDTVLPELDLSNAADFARMAARVDAASSLAVREAAMLLEVVDLEALMRRLKTSNQERREVLALARYARLWKRGLDQPGAPAQQQQAQAHTLLSDAELRRTLGIIGRGQFEAHAELWLADGGDDAAALCERARAILSAGDALVVGELAVRGADLMRELELEPGRHIGELLTLLFEHVLQEPELNRTAALLELARAQRRL